MINSIIATVEIVFDSKLTFIIQSRSIMLQSDVRGVRDQVYQVSSKHYPSLVS